MSVRFRLRAYLHATTNDWHVSITDGIHNHVLDRALQGHLIAGRLKPEEKQLLSELTRNLVPPKNIISTMKERDPNNVSDIKQIYNAHYRFKQRSTSVLTKTTTSLKLVSMVSPTMFKIYFLHILNLYVC